MNIVLGGKFETAVVRSINSIIQPNRNVSTNRYYMGLNRYVPNEYFDRASTFVALASNTVVPEIDWNFPYGKQYHGSLAEVELGIRRDESQFHERDEDTRIFVRIIRQNKVLSVSSVEYISTLILKEYDRMKQEEMGKSRQDIEDSVSEHYLCRLLLQLNVGAEATAFIVVGEEDLRILQEIGQFLQDLGVAAPFELPDLSDKLIQAEDFCDGLLNFSPLDIRSLAAVRADVEIQAYGKVIWNLFTETPSIERERKIIEAMTEAHLRSESGRRAEKIFEVMSWIAKPFHYVPGVDATLSIVEDAKDLGMKWLNRKVIDKEWYLIAPRMQEIAIEEYLSRKSNL